MPVAEKRDDPPCCARNVNTTLVSVPFPEVVTWACALLYWHLCGWLVFIVEETEEVFT